MKAMKTFSVARLLIAVIVVVSSDSTRAQETENDGGLSASGLQVLFDFRGEGTTIQDVAGIGRPLNLKIADKSAVKRAPGSLEVLRETKIVSEQSARRLVKAVQRSNALSLAVWLKSGDLNQSGPARIVSLSKNSTERNFTLGQDKDKFDVRLRTTKTSNNGIPSLSSPAKTVKQNKTHVVYTRDKRAARLFVNGKPVSNKKIDGSFSNWSDSFVLALANEASGGRPWRGTLYQVAIFSRALSPKDVSRLFQAGSDSGANQLAASVPKVDQRQRHFETKVASILSRNCLECHDAAVHKGGLNLADRKAALRGGDSGPSIVAGKPDESLLWESIETDSMPHERAPLRSKEKAAIKQWIADGAVWSLTAIDPAVYVHESRSRQQWVRRLTVEEYIETVRAVTGVDISKDARRLLPRDLRADGFSNTAYNLNVDLKHVSAYAELAQRVVEKMDVAKFARRFSKKRLLTDPVMRPLISQMGQWVMRGPLDEREVVSLRGITTTVASSGGNFDDAVGFVLEAMLQSPRFVYRVENQRGDGTAWPVNAYELATRMSYGIWGGPPDAELMRLAENGELSSDAVEEQTQRMLRDSRAVAQSLRFADDWLNLGRLKNLQPDRKRFPNWDPSLAADMRQETLAYFQHVVWTKERPLVELLNHPTTIVVPALAKYYGLDPANGQKSDNGALRFDTKNSPRGGLLTQGSLLTIGGDDASMVTRGLLVMHELLRGVVNDPPPCVDTTPVASRPGLTQRGIAEQRMKNSACAGCHAKFEPLAFGLEKFDGLGAFHERDEHGNGLRDDGDILFPGSAKPVAYQSSAELMDLLAKSDRVASSFTWKVTQYILGRPLVAADAQAVEKIHAQATKNGGTWQATVRAIMQSDLIQMTETESE